MMTESQSFAAILAMNFCRLPLEASLSAAWRIFDFGYRADAGRIAELLGASRIGADERVDFLLEEHRDRLGAPDRHGAHDARAQRYFGWHFIHEWGRRVSTRLRET